MRHDTESGIGRSHRELFLQSQGNTSVTLNKSATLLFDETSLHELVNSRSWGVA
jgi:hypothetical protein